MPVDAERALASAPRATEISWQHQDVLLYHLGLGAGDPPTDLGELRYALESELRVLPSFATVAGGGPGVMAALDFPGIDVDWADVLHAGQSVTSHRPIPPIGSATRTQAVTAVYDKTSAAVLVLRTEAADAQGPLWSCESRLFVRGGGGFGGERGPSAGGRPPPQREPDHRVSRHTRPEQALLYRLSGDRNPLHADPRFARRAGFDRPILHGLCSYGIALKAVVDTVLAGDVTRVRSCATRFSGVVFPGETLRMALWRETDQAVRLEATVEPGTVGGDEVGRSGAPVLADMLVEHV
ncbi:MaoC/PaaZ C-terminal domain-containing protein [Streptomyces oceani]|uniref:3-alpha,7-alpha, 12-alpha-trihydroxy-5-beta-cholest-24-enoyl-CoA hydratase n=1 Tax=Streptomyces oceani TaxID=1075402 RepID=A0A1E7KF35_9ACTN|nr:MaoC/PaaZ C-terminal domain-containing protein [Streptomyces oceani]OEV02523.1 3-alpha,7-alpha,12-alpha-trihydroxy-5-beta-cholest-24-enoyl-CoA hydratase [Streptomyces oceani]